MVSFHRFGRFASLSLLLGVACAGALAGPPTASSTASPTTQHVYIPPDQAAIKLDKAGKVDADFIRWHKSFLALKDKGPIDLLFLGDSITYGWSHAPDIWQAHFGKYHPANFGIPGDRTQNVLWRIDNGELDGLHPKVVVLLIGTNNSITRAAKLAPAVVKIAREIEEHLPQTHVLMLGIFPRGSDPTDKNDPKTRDVAAIRANLAATNRLLAQAQDDRTQFLDVGSIFLDAKGYIPKDIMADGLHPTAKGYALLADAIQPTLDRMMK